MKYGWLAQSEFSNQKAGFFIDRLNRILFWPNSRGPGYVVSEEQAYQIVGAKVDRYATDGLLLPLVILYFLVDYLAGPFIQMPYLNLEQHLPSVDPHLLSIAIQLISLLIIGSMILNYWNRKKIQSIIVDSRRCEEDRPEPQFLKYREKVTKWQFRTVYPFFLVLGTLFLWIGFYGDITQNERFIFIPTGLIFLSSLIRIYWMESNGVAVADIRFYQPTEERKQREKEWSEKVEAKRKKDSTPFTWSWLTSGWRSHLLLKPLLLGMLLSYLMFSR